MELRKVTNIYIYIYMQLNMFSYMKILHMLSTLGATNSKPNEYKNEPNGKK